MVRALLKHSVPEITVEALHDTVAFKILDTRAKAEFDVSHLPGAIWVGYEDFQLKRFGHLSKGSRILLYCSVGYRSEKVAEKLVRAGYLNVTNLSGGIFAWVNAGKPVYDNDGKITDRIHGYSRAWGIWLKAGKIVYR